MVRVAMAIGSTSARSSHQRSTARTIFITSTGSAVAVALAHLHRRAPWWSGGGRGGGWGGGVRVRRVVRQLVDLGHRLSPRERFGAADREEGTTTRRDRRAWARRGRCAVDVTRPRGHDYTAHGVRGCWQVFGLVDSRAPEDRRPTGRRFPGPSAPVLDDGGRSHLPLRGSPGFAPGSLLPRGRWFSVPDQRDDHIRGSPVAYGTTCCVGVSGRAPVQRQGGYP